MNDYAAVQQNDELTGGQQDPGRPSVLLYITTTGKYIFSIVITFIVSRKFGLKSFSFCILELLLIALLTNAIKNNRARRAFNGVFLLLYNVQVCVRYFANTYVTLVMLTNLDSIEDLSGQAILYISATVLVVVISILPICRIPWKWNTSVGVSLVLAVELLFCMVFGNEHSPFYAYLDLIKQQKDHIELQKIAEHNGVAKSQYYRDAVADYISKPEELPENPNIVIIFTEGLSQHIVEDPRDIMPNVAAYEEKSLMFTDYYNHTFATYRGLIGQLFSGYQDGDYDENKLISLQKIFQDEGYHTTFINTEPNNETFTKYLKRMDFDTLVSNPGDDYEGYADALSDREAYEELYHQMEKASPKDDPFLIGIYTFGTHASLDSIHQKFGDGTDAELNKFYEVDWYFGEFMKKFEKSDMAKDTIIIFTADHATYQDQAYDEAFPGSYRVRVDLDRIPFFIYYQGMPARSVDAGGRNTLDFAPTVCDYLDVTGENYFLGDTLFSPQDSYYDVHFNIGEDVANTKSGELRHLAGEEKDIFLYQVYSYFLIRK